MALSRITTLAAAASRLIALTACAALILGVSSCSSPDDRNDQDGQDDGMTAVSGQVAVFTPADGVTISGNTPLNKWTAFVPALTDALISGGVTKKHISTSTADSLDRQSRDIQDYVVDRVSASGDDSSDDAAHTTLVVAPVTGADDTVRQYGDYVSQSVASSSASDTTDGDDTSANDEAVSRLVSALKLAQENGMHVIMLASTIEGFQPDIYVRMSTAEQIGRIQALKLVSKLDLDKVSKDNPKTIEVLLPYTTRSAQSSKTVGGVLKIPSSSQDEDDTQEPTDDSAVFAKAAFKGLWSVLRPYFKQGRAISASGLLTADTTVDDWRDVSFACVKDDDARAVLRERLTMDSAGDAHTRIDGVIAMNDYVASGVAKELSELGYTGSAADINPSITISGIVENITGKKDLQRQKVPDPIKAPESDAGATEGDTDKDKSAEETNSRWPIVTGYGAYVDVMPQIVSGQQWMTALEDRDALARSVAKACLLFADGTTPNAGTLPSLASSKVNGKTTATIEEDLLAVSAYNLKATLIEPGYITLADAGL
ncbi:hypothetical protein JS541_07105 [Bifidobacterium sp. SO1]|nr:hypothetical protein [Bifidobacterium sp. SO1]MBW3078782.1 hypothetical protein [Bifidobacterium simiiventris]